MPEPTLSDVLSAIAITNESLAQMRGEVGGLREEVAELRAEVAGLRGELDDVKQEQLRFREELTRLRVDVMGRIDRLQDDLTSFRDDHLVTYARIERIDEAARARIQAFEKEINGMHRQIRNLQEEVRQLRGGH